MSKNILFNFILCTGLFFITGCGARMTTIRGTVDKQANLLYSNPGLAVCYDGLLDTLIPDSQGNFELKFRLEEPRFLFIKPSGSDYKYLLPVEPGGSYHLAIDPPNTFLVNGPNKEGIELYQSVCNDGLTPLLMDWYGFFENDTFSRLQMVERVKQAELSGFKTLLDEKKITPSFYNLIREDRDCFYACASADISLRAMLSLYRKPATDARVQAERDTLNRVGQIFDRYRPDDENLMKSPSWAKYVGFMYTKTYKQFLSKNIADTDVLNLYHPQKYFLFWFDQIKQSFSGKSLEAALALLLYEHGGPECEESFPAYHYFTERFPESPYLKYFQRRMDRTESFYAGNRDDSSIRFIESGDSINTLPALFSRFKGKKLYVDVWRSMCGACRRDFRYKDSLDVILKRNDITPLYISLDRDAQEEEWRAVVYAYDIRGFHIRANLSLVNDLKKLYEVENKDTTSRTIIRTPFYLYVDENGHIVNKNFKRPSAIVSTKRFFD